MRERFGWLALAALALAVVGCAGAGMEPPSEMGAKGREALEAGKVKKAYKILAEASERHGDNAADQLAFGDAAMAAEKYDEAFMAYERALIIDDRNADAMMGMAKAAEKLGAPVLALEYYRAAVIAGRGETYADARAKVAELGEMVARRK